MVIKNIEVTGILIIVALVVSALVIINLIDKKKKLNPEVKRKAFHISMGIAMLSFPFLFENIISVGLLGILAILGMLLLKYTKLKKNLGSAIYSVERKSLRRVLLYYFSIFDFLAI